MFINKALTKYVKNLMEIDNIANFFLVQVEHCFSVLYLQKIMGALSTSLDSDLFAFEFNILISEIKLQQVELYLNQDSAPYSSIVSHVVKNSILFDEIIQTILKSTKFVKSQNFTQVPEFFNRNFVPNLLMDYDSLPIVVQNSTHIRAISETYFALAAVLSAIVIALLLRKIMYNN